MSFKETFYPESRFGGFTDIDGTIAFYLRIAALLEPSFVVLDFGCGRGAYVEDPCPVRRQLRIFQGRVQRVIGIDVDEGAAANPVLDEFHLLTGEAWPLDDHGQAAVTVTVKETGQKAIANALFEYE